MNLIYFFKITYSASYATGNFYPYRIGQILKYYVFFFRRNWFWAQLDWLPRNSIYFDCWAFRPKRRLFRTDIYSENISIIQRFSLILNSNFTPINLFSLPCSIICEQYFSVRIICIMEIFSECRFGITVWAPLFLRVIGVCKGPGLGISNMYAEKIDVQGLNRLKSITVSPKVAGEGPD